MKKIIYSFTFLLFCSYHLSAQLKCGNPTYEQAILDKTTSISINGAKLDSFVKKYVHEHRQEAKSGQEYIIPIVFHVIHYYGTEDISDAQILDAVRIINRDYNKLNPDTANTIPQFKNIASSLPVQFRLATVDPGGNCTTGIDRIADMRTNEAGDFSKLDDWPDNQYLNVWTVKTIGANSDVAGYAYTPTTVAEAGIYSYDGVIILSTFVGSIGTGDAYDSRALTHEIGHTQGMLHPWGPTNYPGVACGDDGVDDTPVTEGFDLFCPTAGTTQIGRCVRYPRKTGDSTSVGVIGSPFNGSSGAGCKVQYLLTKPQLDSAQVFGTYIDSISIWVTNPNHVKVAVPNIKIEMGNTLATSLSTAFNTATLTSVYTSGSLTIDTGASILNFKFSQPFIWEGADNVIIQICHDSIPGGYVIPTAISNYGNGLYTIANGACDSATGNACRQPLMTFNLVVIENYQNYMDYSYCSTMFTNDQVQLMEAYLNAPTIERSNIWSQNNLELTGVADTSVHTLCSPKADFYTTTLGQFGVLEQVYCINQSVNLHDASWKGQAATWNWNFGSGATPTGSTEQNPTVTYTTTGYKTISLVVSNSSGTDSITKQNFLYISDPSTAINGKDYFENFEGGSLQSKGWVVLNPEGNNSTWNISNAGGDGSTSSVYLNNYQSTPSDLDVLISPALDLSTFSNPAYLHFEYNCAAGVIDTANVQDVFKAYVSVNCGETWQLLHSISKTALITAGSYFNAEYATPQAGDWTEVVIPLATSEVSNDTRFRFDYFTNGFGNDFYMDNVFVSNSLTGVDNINAPSFNAQVFPNPASGSASLVVNATQATQTKISIYDITGRKISTLYEGALLPGTRTFEINADNLSLKGVYLIDIENDNQVIRKKIVFF